jgi:DNA-binding transcriptional LysR family regulator
MLPTPRALELAPQIHAVLAALEAALDPQHFEPHSAERTFTIDTNDYMVSTAMPVLMARLAELAPGIDVRVLPPAGKAFERLDAREADFALGTYGEIPERFGVAIIDDNDFSCAMREGHALARGRFDLKRYAEARHLLITPRGDPSGFVDEALARHGLTRRIALTVNHFTVVPSIIASTDLITTIPKRIADQYAPLYRLKLRPSPVETPRNYAHIQLLWHKRLGQHAAYNWFRELLFSIVARKRTAGAN